MSDKLMSVSQVAISVGLSRQRFHQLVKQGVFPPPVYDIQTRRPHYTEEQQNVCLAVREKNVGINGKVVLFYSRRLADHAKKTNQYRAVHSIQEAPTAFRADRRT